jgi:predicted SAM-dependent methyltransferase
LTSKSTLVSAPAAVRLNVGAGEWALPDYVNIDATDYPGIDLVASVPPIPYPDDAVDEICAIHFLEHLDQPTGMEFLRECCRVLKPGGTVGIVVPDTRLIVTEYLKNTGLAVEEPNSGGRMRLMRDLDDVCAMFIFSTVQESHHQWAYDEHTLQRAMSRAGFGEFEEIDRFTDPRLGSGQWYQGGWSAKKPV